MKNRIYFFLAIITIFLIACENNTIDDKFESQAQTTSQVIPNNMNNLSQALIEAASQPVAINEVYNSVMTSLEFGLDETMYLDKPEDSTNKTHLKTILQKSKKVINDNGNSSNNEIDFSGLEIYWPYAKNWDGVTIPVVACYVSDSSFVMEDKLWAYKFVKDQNGLLVKDSILVNEEYAIKKPVWIVKNATFNKDDLYRIFKRLPTINGIRLVPRNEMKTQNFQKVFSSVSSSANVAETKVTSIMCTTQHDTWPNGGSEFRIFWFFPTKDFGLAKHESELISLTRDEIKKSTVRSLDFVGNYDWFKGQEHNRLKVLEYDPGKDMEFTIKLTTTYAPKDTSGITTSTYTGEFSTKIVINKVDDDIMEETIPRTSMFTVETKVDDATYRKPFIKNGVTIGTTTKIIGSISTL